MSKKYDRIIGYSPLEDVDEEKMLQVIKVNKGIIEKYYSPYTGDFILVAGAGHGQEAKILGKEYQLKTFGVDLNIENIVSTRECPDLFFQRQDISSLAFLSNTFSLIYCYHVLEHVKDHVAVLRELERVLKPGGVLFIGFPNKNRFVSYIGTSQKVSTRNKIKWNLIDYGYRLRGQFDNHYGAHAGFAQKDFVSIAEQIFGAVHSVRDQYMLYKYSRYSRAIWLLIKIGLNEFVFPSNYFICIKN
jgi:SAM-dependent methyltransferase